MKKCNSPRRTLILTTIIVIALLPSAAVAVTADQIWSKHIKEADGVSRQNTNAGSGIKTGHIQNRAITTAKIAREAVTNAKIKAVSMNKVTGLEEALAAKADQSTVDALNTALVAKAEQSDLDALSAVVTDLVNNPQGLTYGNITFVATSGGEYSSPVEAMNGLADWCGVPSADNPCMVKIMPGYYDIGGGTVTMRSYVDIEGSGQNVTIIAKRSAPAASDTVIATTAVHNSEIRSVTVERIPQTGNSLVTAISGTSNTISIRDASIIVNNGANAAEAVVNKYGNISLQGVDIDSSHVSIRLEDNDLVQISDSNLASNASYAGAYLQGRVNDYASVRNSVFDNRRIGSFTRGLHIVWYPIPAATNGNEFKVDLEDTTVYGNRTALLAVNGVNLTMTDINITSEREAMQLSSGVTSISSSVISGSTRLRFGAVVGLAHSEINGLFTVDDGTVKCFGTYDENLDPVACP